MGRARTGKSGLILREIARAGEITPERRQILLVPEHASHIAEVDVCRNCGDCASRHAEVLTFKLLASRVLSIVGGSSDISLDAGGKLLTLQRSLQELSGVLKVYGKPSRRSAFLKNLLDVIEELIAYAIAPEVLAATAEKIDGEIGGKLQDIALIYGIYLSKLHADGRDARDRLEKLENNLEESHYIDGKDIYLDGFSYFTGREIRILRILLRRSESVTITLLGDESDNELFRESLHVREQLVREAVDAGVAYRVDYLPAGEASGALDHVERFFFGKRTVWKGDHHEIRLWEASDIYTEAERTASEILRLVREENYRFRDITVAARNLSIYESTVETVFNRYGIPLYSARRSDILQQPVTALLLGALDAATGGFEYEDVFRCLKTGLAGIEAEECDLLENYVLTWDIHGQMWVRELDWTAHPDGYGLSWDEASVSRLAAVNILRAKIQKPFARLYNGLRAGSARKKAIALYTFLEDVNLPETLEEKTRKLFENGDTQRSEETAQLWTILCGVLDQMVEILGDTVIDAEEFARLIRLILTQYSVGSIPVALDRVNLSELTRNDRHSVRVLFLLGANDGVVPSVESGNSVLREEERAVLERFDIRLSPYGMSAFHLEIQNIYAALAQPTERLYVSYSIFASNGTAQQPSFLIGRLQSLFDGLSVEKEDDDKAYRLSALTPALEYAGEHIDGTLWRFLEQKKEYANQLRAMRESSLYSRGRLSGDAVKALYGQSITLSASRLDKARACHFAYFMQYGLHARERGAAGFDAPQMGTFVHDVMEHTLRAARDKGGIKSLTKKQLHAMTRRAVSDYIQRELPDLAEKTARFRYLFRRLVESTYRIMDEVSDELRESDFEPLAFELSFGMNAQLPAIVLSSGSGELRVVGQVDRVDGWLVGNKLYLRVVDYKTGKKSLDLAELRYGLGLQMLLYLFALEREGKDLFGAREIIPAGVLYTPARDNILRLPRNTDDETLRREAQKLLRRSGMVLSDPVVLKAMEHSALEEPHRLPITVKRDKDGHVNLSGSLASAEQLGKLAKYVDKILRDIGREAERGNIDADPYVRTPQETACTYCPYVAACGFEPGRGGDHYEYIAKTGPDEFWSAVDASINGGKERSDGYAD